MSNDSQPLKAASRTGSATMALRHEIELLRHDGESLRSQLADRDETIRDLRARLDGETEERRRLTALLTDQRARP